MIALVNRFKSKQLSIQEFLAHSRQLLGERLYQLLAQGMNNAMRLPGGPMMMRPPGAPVTGFPPASTMMPQAGDATTDAIDFSDVSRMDSSALQDVIQYSGIDLKAESEMIESELHAHNLGGGSTSFAQDFRLRPEYFFNVPRMKAIVYMAIKARGLTSVSEEVFELIALALQRRLLNIITGMSEISKHRVDAGRLAFKIKVENDPKKQLWLLEKIYEEELDKRKGDLMGTQKAATDDKSKAKKPAVSEKKASEDVLVKTRLANTTAMAALGVQQKSWMTAGIVGLQSNPIKPTVTSSSVEDTTDSTEAMEPVKIPLHFSQAPSVTPVTDRDLLLQINSRTISLKDLVFFCERDSHLSRSPIMLTLYDLSNF